MVDNTYEHILEMCVVLYVQFRKCNTVMENDSMPIERFASKTADDYFCKVIKLNKKISYLRFCKEPPSTPGIPLGTIYYMHEHYNNLVYGWIHTAWMDDIV